jgi:hypothetical protein
MTIQESLDFLNFWINKYTGAWYTIPELELIMDRGQLSLFEDLQPQYATSQRIKDALAPFRTVYGFNNQFGLNLQVPDSDYVSLLSFTVSKVVDGRTVYSPVKMYNEDELAHRLMSQIDPLTDIEPVGEVAGKGAFNLYPLTSIYVGNVVYFKRPAKINIISSYVNRVLVIDPASVGMTFPENWQNAVLMKALSSVGINIGEQDVMQYAEMKNQSNFLGQNMV